jgi:hypothetical protein
MKLAKRLVNKQITEDTELDISDWLSFRFELAGTAPVRIGQSKRLAETEDVYCRDSDGIPFEPGTKISINFDPTGSKNLMVEYELLICCD